MTLFVEEAFRKGYRVTDNGQLLNPRGEAMTVTRAGKYPRVGVWIDGRVRPVYVHHLAALCFFGEAALKAPCVRHKDGDRLNVRRDNILIGTYSENEQDKAPEVRMRVATTASRSTRHHLDRPADTASKRWCSECKKYVNKKLFRSNKLAVSGLDYRCNPCRAERERRRRANVQH